MAAWRHPRQQHGMASRNGGSAKKAKNSLQRAYIIKIQHRRQLKQQVIGARVIGGGRRRDAIAGSTAVSRLACENRNGEKRKYENLWRSGENASKWRRRKYWRNGSITHRNIQRMRRKQNMWLNGGGSVSCRQNRHPAVSAWRKLKSAKAIMASKP